jgi:arylformamidase
VSAGLLDISVPLGPSTPAWPGSPGFSSRLHSAMADGEPADASTIVADVHCGTHVDAPAHFIRGGGTVSELDLGALVGPAHVASTGGARRIGAAELEAAAIPRTTERLLLRTVNSGGWSQRPFDPDFAALTADGARWVVERGIRLIGIDYLAVQRFEDGPETHLVLLGAGVAILEGLELGEVAPGAYELLCLPLRLDAAEAAPARAVLRELAP